ncbi:MAG: hypothetical protein GY866_18875 [Proteobacteria bacterium]|nr:hypothetical protein [Pseudomonadota bacterium]
MLNTTLEKIIDDLDRLSRDAAGDFLTLDNDLNVVVEAVNENASCASSVLGMIEDGSRLNIVAVQTPVDRISRSVNDTFLGIITNLNDLNVRIGKILELKATLEDVSHAIRNVSLLMKIKTTKLGRSEFDHVVMDLETLSRRIRQNTVGINRSAVEANDNILTLRDSLNNRLNTFNLEFDKSRRKVQQLFEKMTGANQDIKDKCLRIKELTSRNGAELEEVAAALKNQEVSRQQLEHVVQALKQAVSRTPGGTDETNDRNEFNKWLADIIKQQIDRIEAMIDATNQTAQKISNHFTQISILVAKQMADAKTILHHINTAALKLKTIEADLKSLSGSLSLSREKTSEIMEAISSINENIARVSTEVSQIELSRNDLEALTYNAVFKAAKVGVQGKVMGAITDEITTLSQEVQAKIVDKEDVIRSIITSSKEFKLTLSEKLNNQLDESKENEQQIQDTTIKFFDDCNSVSQISKVVATLETNVKRVVAGIRFDKVFNAGLRKIVGELRTTMEEIDISKSGTNANPSNDEAWSKKVRVSA